MSCHCGVSEAAIMPFVFDGLHGHLDGAPPHAGVQLGSGKCANCLVYVEDGVLLSRTSAGLQPLLGSMHSFCQAIGLTMSLFEMQVMVFNGTASACRSQG